MSISIRMAREEDFPYIYSLLLEFARFQQTPERVTTSIEQMKKDKDIFHCLVAENGQKTIIGYATYFISYFSWSGKAMYLDDLYVTTAFRGQQAGTLLIKKIVSIAQENECNKVRWQVSRWNTDALNFYKSLGARIDETEYNCDLIL
jgi:diamine N-acetyltransferase